MNSAFVKNGEKKHNLRPLVQKGKGDVKSDCIFAQNLASLQSYFPRAFLDMHKL